jgi:hypothetical protein
MKLPFRFVGLGFRPMTTGYTPGIFEDKLNILVFRSPVIDRPETSLKTGPVSRDGDMKSRLDVFGFHLLSFTV